MVSIGEIDVKILKAIAEAGGAVLEQAPGLHFETEALEASFERLLSADYLERQDTHLKLTDIAEEYLEVLGVL